MATSLTLCQKRKELVGVCMKEHKIEEKEAIQLVAQEIGIAWRTIRDDLGRLKKVEKEEEIETDGVVQQVELTENSKSEFKRETINTAVATNTFQGRAFSEEEMFTLFEIDPDVWYVEKKIVNSWGKNFQTKLHLKRKEGAFEFKEIKDNFTKWAIENAPQVRPKAYDVLESSSNNMLEVNVADLHLGKIAWNKESGDNFNLKIACDVFKDAIINIISRAKPIGFSKIILSTSGDFFNAELKPSTTTKGTPQQLDSRWKKVFSMGIELMQWAIEYCRTYAPVHVPIVLGNHCEETEFYWGEALSALYLRCDDVTIDNNPKDRKYFQFGKCMIGYTHGEKIKPEKLSMIMAQEMPEMWSSTKYRYWHLGHLHSNKQLSIQVVDNSVGVVVQNMPSLSGTDAWHCEAGFVGSMHEAKGFVWNKDRGREYEISYIASDKFYE
jgi:hypothetical protein